MLLIGVVLSVACASPSSGRPPAAEPAPRAAPSPPDRSAPGPERAVDPLDLEELEQLTTPAELRPHVGDERVEARRIVAQRLAEIGGSGSEPLLTSLADDPDLLVAARALAALGALADARGDETVARALGRRSWDEQNELVTVMQDEIGGTGLLVLTLGLPLDPKHRWFRQKKIFDALQNLRDPRAADSLVRFIASAPHPHYAFRAAAELAELGDPRALPFLAKRLRQETLKIYAGDTDWERSLTRDDSERSIAARYIADLAVMHPDRAERSRRETEDALRFYVTDPWPHANAMRALAALRSQKALPELRGWAFPNVPLPKEYQQPPMPEEWVLAQSAQRYVGLMRDQGSFPQLLASLKARPAQLDVSMSALLGGNSVILGMSLNAVGIGAAQGVSEFGDPKAIPALFAHMRDPRNNEQSRFEACIALAWLASEADTERLIDEVYRATKDTTADQFRRVCVLEGLARRASHVRAPRLLAMLEPQVPDAERSAAARSIARAGIDAQFEEALLMRAHYDVSGNDAVLALVLAGSPEAAAQSLERHVKSLIADRLQIASGIALALESLSQEDIDRGFLFSVLRNADAAAEAGHAWVQSAVVKALENIVYDSGPHSLTRPVLRHRLYRMAQSNRALERERALRALWYFRERGTLLALANASSPGAAVAQAQHQLLLRAPAPE